MQQPDAPPELEGNPPIPTVYVSNLNEKLSQIELKKALYAIFSQFGPILEILATKNHKMRGQAFVVFRDVADATQAHKVMNGFPFYGKPLKIDYAKTKSDATKLLDGSYEAKVKEARAAKRKLAHEERRKRMVAAKTEKSIARGPSEAVHTPEQPAGSLEESGGEDVTESLPNAILFVENLPDAANDMMLSMLFQQFPGFKEVRLVPGKSGIAFVEYESDVQSGVAMGGLQGFKITPTHLMKISFAKQ